MKLMHPQSMCAQIVEAAHLGRKSFVAFGHVVNDLEEDEGVEVL